MCRCRQIAAAIAAVVVGLGGEPEPFVNARRIGRAGERLLDSAVGDIYW